MCRTVVVYDYNWGGHIPAYHRLIVESALRSGWRVASLSGGGGDVRSYISLKLVDGKDRSIIPDCPELGLPPERASRLAFLRWLPGGFGIWRRIRSNPYLRARHALNRWVACRRELERIRPQLGNNVLLFLPNIDDMVATHLPARFMKTPFPWAGIYMSASDLRHPQLCIGIEQRLKKMSVTDCRGLAVLDEVAAQKVRAYAPHLAVATLPDIADDSLGRSSSSIGMLQELQRRAKGRKIIGLLGHLSEAKSLAIFLDVATASHNRDLFFLIAGQYEELTVSPLMRQRLANAAIGSWENLWTLLGRIPSESDFNCLLQAVDAVFAVYHDFTRSSNILTKAALFRRPVVVASGYCMADRVQAYRLGLTVDQDSLAECESAVRQLLSESTPGADYAGYARDFSQAQFQAHLADFFTACIVETAG